MISPSITSVARPDVCHKRLGHGLHIDAEPD